MEFWRCSTIDFNGEAERARDWAGCGEPGARAPVPKNPKLALVRALEPPRRRAREGLFVTAGEGLLASGCAAGRAHLRHQLEGALPLVPVRARADAGAVGEDVR